MCAYHAKLFGAWHCLLFLLFSCTCAVISTRAVKQEKPTQPHVLMLKSTCRCLKPFASAVQFTNCSGTAEGFILSYMSRISFSHIQRHPVSLQHYKRAYSRWVSTAAGATQATISCAQSTSAVYCRRVFRLLYFSM